MGVTHVGTAQSGGGGTSTTRSWTHSMSGSANRALTIALFYGDTREAVSALTVDEVDVLPQLKLAALHSTSAIGIRVYVVTGLATGDRAIAVTYAAGCENWYASDETQDVDQTNPVRAGADFVDGGSTGGTFGPTIDSGADDLVQVVGVADSSPVNTPGSQTSRYNDSASDGKGLSDKAGASPDIAGEYTIPAGPFVDYVVGALSLQPASSGVTGNSNTALPLGTSSAGTVSIVADATTPIGLLQSIDADNPIVGGKSGSLGLSATITGTLTVVGTQSTAIPLGISSSGNVIGDAVLTSSTTLPLFLNATGQSAAPSGVPPAGGDGPISMSVRQRIADERRKPVVWPTLTAQAELRLPLQLFARGTVRNTAQVTSKLRMRVQGRVTWNDDAEVYTILELLDLTSP